MKEKILEEFGLTKNEVKVYLTLLSIGSGLAGDITKKSGIHRRNVYDCIERLNEKGLVSYIVRDKKKWFEAVDPERFLGMVDEWRNELTDMEGKIKTVLPELRLSKEMSKVTHEIQYFKGHEGIKSVHDDILRAEVEYVGYGPGKKMEKALRFFHKHFINMRIKKEIPARFIYEQSYADKVDVMNLKFAEVRFLPDEICSHAGIRVYGDKTALFFLATEPLAIVIHNQEIADSYRHYFEVMWDAAGAMESISEHKRKMEKFQKIEDEKLAAEKKEISKKKLTDK